MLNPVSAREVAQFVGIHIAMGTLKVRTLLRTLWLVVANSVYLNEKLIGVLCIFSFPV